MAGAISPLAPEKKSAKTDGEFGTAMEIQGGGGGGSSEGAGGPRPDPKELAFEAEALGVEVPPGLPPSGAKAETGDTNMAELVQEMRKMNTNMTVQFSALQQQISDQASQFKSDLAKLREEMVTRSMFEDLEERIKTLETQGLASPEVNWLQQQAGRLDPANRSLAFTGFVEKDLGKRRSLINSYMDQIGCETEIRSMDHIWTGAIGNRSVGPITIVEVASRNVREEVLKKFNEANSTKKDAAGGNISIGRAKTSLQLKRNGALKQAMKLVKQDSRASGKSVEICWLIEGSNLGVD